MRVSSARARALLAMATGSARVVVASAPALLQRLTAPSILVARSLGVRTGAEIDPLALSSLLAEAGYDRQDPVDDHGEYLRARRHPRRLSPRRDLADPHRVHRRPGRVDPALRPGHAAIGRDPRPVPRRAGARAGRSRPPPAAGRVHGLRLPDRGGAAGWWPCRSPTSPAAPSSGHSPSPRRATTTRSAGRARRRRCRPPAALLMPAGELAARLARGVAADRPPRRQRRRRRRRCAAPRHHPADAAVPRPDCRLGAGSAGPPRCRRRRRVRGRNRRAAPNAPSRCWPTTTSAPSWRPAPAR